MADNYTVQIDLEIIDAEETEMILDKFTGIDGKSAYQYAVEHGYTGTEEEFAEYMANAAEYSEHIQETVDDAIQDALDSGDFVPDMEIGTVQTVPHGQSASATITGTKRNPVLNLNIPQGASGNETIDDTAGFGDDDLVWSADKTLKEVDSKADVICKTIDTPSAIVTFEDGADDLPVKEMKITIEPVQEGTGDPSPDNVRPITGWTRAKVTRTGKNLIPNNYSSRTINGVTFSVNNDGSISVSGTPTGNATFAMTFDINADFGVVVLNGIDYATNIRWDTVTLLTANGETIVTFSQTDDKERIIDLTQYPTVARMSVLFKRKTNEVEVSGTVFPMLRKQNESAEWEPYQSTTYPITFPSEAGTVYGGNLTIHADGTGELVVDRFIRNLYSAYPTGWRTRLVSSNTIRQYYHGHDSAMVRSNPTDICTHAVNQSGSTADKVRFTTSDMVYISFPVEKAPGETAEAFQSWLEEQDSNGTPVAICYTRKNPISYQLSAPQVRTLLGLNHIWADTGNVELLTYPVDTASAVAEVDSRVTTTQDMIAGSDASVATESHVVGDVFICDNKLYKATAAIAVGESIIEGSNVAQTSVAELLLNKPDFVFNAAVMKNHPVSVTLENQSRAIVFATGANAERVALMSLLGGSSQAYAWDIHASAQLTATIDGSTVTLAYSGSGSCFMDILKLSGNVTATMA